MTAPAKKRARATSAGGDVMMNLRVVRRWRDAGPLWGVSLVLLASVSLSYAGHGPRTLPPDWAAVEKSAQDKCAEAGGTRQEYTITASPTGPVLTNLKCSRKTPKGTMTWAISTQARGGDVNNAATRSDETNRNQARRELDNAQPAGVSSVGGLTCTREVACDNGPFVTRACDVTVKQACP